MQDFPTPPLRRGSTPVGGPLYGTSSLPPLAPPLPALSHDLRTTGAASSSRSPSVSPTPSRPRRSSKRAKADGWLTSSPMSPSWSSSTASSSASTASGGTAGAAQAAQEEQEEQDKLERARDVKASLYKLEGTAAAVVREQEHEFQREQQQQQLQSLASSSKDTLDVAVSPAKRLPGHKKSTGSLSKLSSAEQLRELARGKRRQGVGVGTSVSSRASVSTFQSCMSTGDSIYEDAVETPSAWTEDEGNDGDSSSAETDGTEGGTPILENGAYPPTQPATPPPKIRTTSEEDLQELPPRAFSPPQFRPVFGAAKLDMDHQKKLHHRRSSLQAEYQGGPRLQQRQSLQLEPSSTMIPLRRYSAVPKGFGAAEPTSLNRRHSSVPGFDSPTSSNGDLSSSTIVPPTPESRRSSFQLKPLVLTPQRTLIAPLTSSPSSSTAGSPSMIRRRMSDQFSYGPTANGNFNRHSSLNARPTSPFGGGFGGRMSPLSFGAGVSEGPSRRRSMGYVESSQTKKRESGSSAGHGPPSAGTSASWGERRMRSASEDTGFTRTTRESSLGDGISPDSSMSSWSEEEVQLQVQKNSPEMNDKEWEEQYHKRSVTPLGVLEEGRQVERWEEDGTATKRRTFFEESEEEEKHRRQKEEEERMAAIPPVTPITPSTPTIELSEPSPTGVQHPREGPPPTSFVAPVTIANGLPSPAPPLDDDETHPPSPPPTFPLPSIPVTEGGHNGRRPSTSAKSVKSVKSTKPRKSHRKPVKYDEHWNGESFVDSSPSTTYSPFDSPIVSEQSTRGGDAGAFLVAGVSAQANRPTSTSPRSTLFASALSTPEDEEPPAIIPDFKSIQIKSRSGTSGSSNSGSIGRTPRQPLRLERTDISPVSTQGEFPPAAHELGHAKSFAHSREEKRRSSQATSKSTGDLRSGGRELAGLAIWPPPDAVTKKVSAGPRIATPTAGESDPESPPSPILYYKDDDPRHITLDDRRGSYSNKRESAYGYLPRRPAFEPRDPRAQVDAPDNFLEVLLNTEPPGRRNTFESVATSDETRWSTHTASTTATSQMTSHIPGQPEPSGRRNSTSPSSSPTKGMFTKRIFGSFSKDKEKKKRPESVTSALQASLMGSKKPISIPAGGTSKAPRPISIPARPPGAAPSIPASLGSRRGSASSRPTSTISTANSFLPRQAPVSPLFGHPSQLEGSPQEELADFAQVRYSPPQPRSTGYQPRRGPVNDDVEEELADWNPRASISSIGSAPSIAAPPPRAYQLPPGLGGPHPSTSQSTSHSNSQHRKKQQRSGSGSSGGRPELPSPSLTLNATSTYYGMPASPSGSNASYGSSQRQQQDAFLSSRTRQGSFEAPPLGQQLASRRPSAQSQRSNGALSPTTGGPPTPSKAGLEFEGGRRGSGDASGGSRRGSADSQGKKKHGLPFGVRDVMRAQVMER